jgi:hypothetical protein
MQSEDKTKKVLPKNMIVGVHQWQKADKVPTKRHMQALLFTTLTIFQ